MTYALIFVAVFWVLAVVAIGLGIIISADEWWNEHLYSSDSGRYWPAQNKEGEKDG